MTYAHPLLSFTVCARPGVAHKKFRSSNLFYCKMCVCAFAPTRISVFNRGSIDRDMIWTVDSAAVIEISVPIVKCFAAI